jgi:alpha-tubulin suppressor-like RCC1 family protein
VLPLTPRLPCSRSPLEDCLTKKVICVLTTLALSFIAAACDEEVISGPGFICDVTNPVTALELNPGNATLAVRVPAQATDTLQLSAVVLGRNSTVRTDVPIEFTSSDPTVATVDSAGIVHGLKPGAITIKAVTCGKTATAQITVVAAVVTVQAVAAAPSILVDDSVLVTARALTQTGAALPGAKFTFTVSPAGSATVKAKSDSTAYVFGNTAGTLTVTATGEGSSGSASIIVLPRSFLAGSAISGGLDAGGDITCGLISLGEGFCWGLNKLGQLGAKSDSASVCFSEVGGLPTAQACSLLPLRFAPTLAFTTVAAGDSSACAIATSGRAYCWGDNSLGQIGNGSRANKPTPTLVIGAQSFTSISVGGGHACALDVGGAAYCWGQDSSGQLGDARRVNSTTPIPVSSGGQAPAVFTSISAGYRHTCALAPGGTAYCWGNNDSAQVGNGGTGSADTPAAVAGGLQFVQISAGGDHSCGIAVGGAAYCWGSNAHGQLGTGAVGGGASSVPVPVAGGLTFIRISASQGTDTTTSRGAQRDTTITATNDTIITDKTEKSDGFGHTCGLTTTGAVYCWGDNSDLQLGVGPTTGGSGPIGFPLQVLGGELPGNVTFTTVSAGTRHTCGVGSDGNAYCWGSDVFGALGNTLQAAFRGFPQRVATPR